MLGNISVFGKATAPHLATGSMNEECNWAESFFFFFPALMISHFPLTVETTGKGKNMALSARFVSRGHVLVTGRDHTNMEYSHEIASRKRTLSSVVSADTAAEMSRANTDSPYPYWQQKAKSRSMLTRCLACNKRRLVISKPNNRSSQSRRNRPIIQGLRKAARYKSK